MHSLAPLTRREALVSWRGFLPMVLGYGENGNYVENGHGNVSRLGAVIRFRTLLEDEIIQETLARHSFRGAGKWLQ